MDSAQFYVNKAIKFVKSSNVKTYIHLEYALGVIDFKRGNFENSITSFENSSIKLDSIEDYLNLAFSESYLGESYLRNNDTLIGIPHLKNAANYFNTKGFTNSGVRSAVQTLANYHKNHHDPIKELEYLKILISIDSINHNDKTILQNRLYKDYDLPNNVKRKDAVIEEISQRNTRKSYYLGLVILVVILFGIWIIYIKKTSRKKLKLYENIVEKYKASPKRRKISNPQSKIPEKDVIILNEAFSKYEDELYYTKSEFNKEFIRKDTGINNHYIADYMRDFVGSSFSQYVNRKRIELAIKKIMEDSKYSKYTMEAMALGVGYNNSATFKRAFKTIVGLTPLEFIKKTNNS